jgi:hypothetical protein
MTWAQAIQAHPELTGDQHLTLGRLMRAHGVPFAFSVVACAALPTWQNVGTVSIRVDGAAFKVATGEVV